MTTTPRSRSSSPGEGFDVPAMPGLPRPGVETTNDHEPQGRPLRDAVLRPCAEGTPHIVHGMVKIFDVEGSKSTVKPPTDGVVDVTLTDSGDHAAELGAPEERLGQGHQQRRPTRATSARRSTTGSNTDFDDGRRGLRRLLQHRARGRAATRRCCSTAAWARLAPNGDRLLRGVEPAVGQVGRREQRRDDDDATRRCTPTSRSAEPTRRTTSTRGGPGRQPGPVTRPARWRDPAAATRSSRRAVQPPISIGGSSSSTMRAASSWNARAGRAVGRGRARPGAPASPPSTPRARAGSRATSGAPISRGERVAAAAAEHRVARAVGRDELAHVLDHADAPSCTSGAPCRRRAPRPSARASAGVVTTSISACGSMRARPIWMSPVPGGMSMSR